MLLFFFFLRIIYFEIISDSQKSCQNRTKRSCFPIIQTFQMIIFYCTCSITLCSWSRIPSGTCSVCSVQVFWVSSSVEEFLGLPPSSVSLMVLKNTALSFCKMTLHCLIVPHSQAQVVRFWQVSPTEGTPLQGIISGALSWLVPLLIMWTLITWSCWCLSSFSTSFPS